MLNASRIKTTVVGFIAALLVSACAIPDGARTGYRSLPPELSLVVFDLPEFDGRDVSRVVHGDHMQREEYALFRGAGAQAEVIYAKERRFFSEEISLDYHLTTETAIRAWNRNQGKPITLGKVFFHESDLAGFWYRTFRVAGSDRDCVGFNGEWDNRTEDFHQYPGKVMFGYYCPPDGQAFDLDAAEAVLDKLGVRGINRRLRDPIVELTRLPAHPGQSELAKIARSGADSGTSLFPMNIAKMYETISGGECMSC